MRGSRASWASTSAPRATPCCRRHFDAGGDEPELEEPDPLEPPDEPDEPDEPDPPEPPEPPLDPPELPVPPPPDPEPPLSVLAGDDVAGVELLDPSDLLSPPFGFGDEE
jgi:hypothetical protein